MSEENTKTREEFIEEYTGEHFGDVNSLKKKLADLAGLLYDLTKRVETLELPQAT